MTHISTVQGLEWADGQTSLLISDATGWRDLKVLPYMDYGTLGCHVGNTETPCASLSPACSDQGFIAVSQDEMPRFVYHPTEPTDRAVTLIRELGATAV